MLSVVNVFMLFPRKLQVFPNPRWRIQDGRRVEKMWWRAFASVAVAIQLGFRQKSSTIVIATTFLNDLAQLIEVFQFICTNISDNILFFERCHSNHRTIKTIPPRFFSFTWDTLQCQNYRKLLGKANNTCIMVLVFDWYSAHGFIANRMTSLCHVISLSSYSFGTAIT